ncbi:hypothetical protein AB1K84_19660 [Mesobacillus foraminis]|uniref:hypothetical protein n=1 Tax=Mesobacillus foraminis TaxID=279826 RepID=UPI0039A39322
MMKTFFYPTVAALVLHRLDEGFFFNQLSLCLVFIGWVKPFFIHLTLRLVFIAWMASFYPTVAAAGLHRLNEAFF